jgi:hypothetical protein
MLGSDLNSAYAPFNSDNEVISPFLQDSPPMIMSEPMKTSEIMHKSTPIVNLGNNIPISQPQPQFQSPIVPSSSINSIQHTQSQEFSSQHMNQSLNKPLTQPLTQDQKIAVLLTELRKQQQLTSNMKQQSSYLDKLFSKKKDLLRIIQLSLVVVLALSLHFIIDHYLKHYIESNDLTFERELIIRLLYPISLVFILWNMKVFVR